MDEKLEPVLPELELKGPGVDFWTHRKDLNAALKTDEDIWRVRRHLADEVSDAIVASDAAAECVKG